MIALGLALLFATGGVAGGDPLGEAIDKVIADVRDGVDFSTGPFKGLVSASDAKTFAAMKVCTVGPTTLPPGGRMAILQWDCPAESGIGHPLAMIGFEDGKVTALSVAAPAMKK